MPATRTTVAGLLSQHTGGNRLKMTQKQSRRDKSVTGAKQQRGHKAAHYAMEGLSKHNYWSLHVTAFYVSLLATAIRAPCTLIPCVHRLKRSSPAGNRKSPNLLANDDATGFLAFAHSRCNQHQQGKDKQTLIDDGTKTAAA